MADEAVDDFRSSLADLTFNSKPLINMLTMLAEENAQYAEQIVHVIEEHIRQVVPSHKLPALYLIDSVIKNISDGSYLQLFTKNIVNNFVLVFEQVDEKTRQAMFKLRQTWNDLFPNKKLYTLDVRVNHIDPAWPISAPAPQTATTSIHVNPKFLLKTSAVESHEPSADIAVLPPTTSDLAPRIDEQQKAEEEAEEARLRQQLIAREELEIMRLEQQKLEIALAEAKSRLEQQDRLLRERQAAQMSRKPASPPSSAVRVSAVVAPSARDPRVRTDLPVDPRLQSSSSFHQTAVVLPTQAKPLSTVTEQPDTARQMQQNASSTTVENIFDILLKDLRPAKSATIATPHAADSVACSAALFELKSDGSSASVAESSANKGSVIVKQEPDNIRQTAVSVNEAAKKPDDVCHDYKGKSKEIKLKEGSQRATSHSPTPHTIENKHSDVVCEETNDSPSCSQEEDRLRSQHDDILKSSRRRSSSQDREKPTGDGRWTSGKEKDSGPAAKRMRHDRLKNIHSSESLTTDFMELFGKEDKDYRSLPPIPKLRPVSPRRQPLLGSAPSSGLTSPQAVGWANFKASRPDDFPSDHRENVSESDLMKKAPLLPTPFMEQQRDAVDEKLGSFSGMEESDRFNAMSTKDRFRKVHPEEFWERSGDQDSSYPRSSSRSPAHHPAFYDNQPVQCEIENRLPPPDTVLRRHESGPWPFCEHEEQRMRPCCEHEDQRVLLPTPVDNHHPVSGRYSNNRMAQTMELWEAPVKPVYNEDRFYMPDFDVRWRMRAQAVDSSLSSYTVVIDGRHYDMNVNGRPRFIKCHNIRIKVALNGYNRELVIDDLDCYHFGSPAANVRIHHETHTVFVQGPQKKLWIDDNLFEINVDAPPEMINIGGRRHEIQIDSASNSVIVDGHHVCECVSDGVQDVQLAYVLHKIQFSPPKKEILIDGQSCTLDMTGKYPVVWIDRQPHGIRFDGPPRFIYIDDLPYLVPMDWARKCRIDGPKPRLLAFGGPGHEVIVDDQWFEVKFGGAEKLMKFGGRVHKIQLRGDPPEVKILPEVILKDQRGPNVFGGTGVNDVRRYHHFPAISDNNEPVRHAVEHLGRDAHHNSPGHNSEARSLSGFTENMPWLAQNAPARRSDPRLGPDASVLYGKPVPQFGQLLPPDIAVSQPVTWMTGNETSAPPSTAAEQSTLTPGGSIDVNLLLTRLLAKGLIGQKDTSQPGSESSASVTSSAVTDSAATAAAPSDSDVLKKDAEDAVEPVPQISDFVTDNLRKRYHGAIQQLYTGIGCSSCGLRFSSEAVDKYTDHLDWHFRQNQREKDEMKVAKCRQWYYDMVDWIQYEELSSEDVLPADVCEADGFNSSLYATQSALSDQLASIPNVIICPQASGDENEDICDVCRESFEQCWSEERESWHLKDAISVNGKIYHPVCFEDVKESLANEPPGGDVVMADDVKVSNDVSVAEMSELNSCDADNTSSVIDLDRTSVVSSIKTSAPLHSDDNIVVSADDVSDTIKCSAAEPATGTQSELNSRSPLPLVVDTSVDADGQCDDVQEACKPVNLDTVDINSVGVCETTSDETICRPVVSESVPPSIDMPVTFPNPAAEVGEVAMEDEPDGMQLDVAECVEIDDTADGDT